MYTDGGLKRGERKETTQEKCTERVVPPGVANYRERPVKEYAKKSNKKYPTSILYHNSVANATKK